jgi:hypothetical protein
VPLLLFFFLSSFSGERYINSGHFKEDMALSRQKRRLITRHGKVIIDLGVGDRPDKRATVLVDMQRLRNFRRPFIETNFDAPAKGNLLGQADEVISKYGVSGQGQEGQFKPNQEFMNIRSLLKKGGKVRLVQGNLDNVERSRKLLQKYGFKNIKTNPIGRVDKDFPQFEHRTFYTSAVK